MEKHQRFIDKEEKPTNSQIKKALGKKALTCWNEITNYISNAYDIEPEQIFGGKNYGWSFKYGKASKMLCSLFPEKESFTVLIVFAKDDLDNLAPYFSDLSLNTQELINETRQYFDGKWVKFRYPNHGNIKDIKIMLNTKLKPNCTIV